MAPPKPVLKRSLEDGSTSSSPGTPAPTTPASEPSEEPKKPNKRPRRNAEEQVALTPLHKAKDMCTKLLKKKSDASTLSLTLQSLPYADALSKEMGNFAKQFELFD